LINNATLKTKQEKEYFKKIVKGHTTDEIIELFNKKFNRVLTKGQVKNYKRKYKLTSGIDTKFKKGQKATGKPFKKGNIPHNKKENLYEFISTDGYTYVKIDDNKFIQKQRYLYQKYKGEIPKGYSVMFLDQDKTNFELENLILVEDNIMKSTIGTRQMTKNKDINKTLILISKLKDKLKKKEK